MKRHVLTSLLGTILISLLFTACGVRVHSSPSEHLVYDDFVTFSLYEVDPWGDLSFLVSDCINLDDRRDEGSVFIETPHHDEELIMHWQLSAGSLYLEFEDHYQAIFSTDFSSRYFRQGQSVEFSLGTTLSEYLIELNGPLCLAP